MMWFKRQDEELDEFDPQRLLAQGSERAMNGVTDMARALARFRRNLRRGGFSRTESYQMSLKLFEQLLSQMQDES